MKIRIKRRGVIGVKKLGLDGRIERVEKHVEGDKEIVSIFFRGLEGLGALRLSKKELELIYKKLTPERKAAKKIVKKK